MAPRGDHLETGREAENRAAALLRSRGWTVLDRNYRAPRGELDIVARDGEYVVFVEVRARHSDDFGDPVETVGAAKRAALRRAARAWLAAHAMEDEPVRFDIITFGGAELDEVARYEDVFGFEDPWG